MFNMKFHSDERSMDMTRRRRWHRKMIPNQLLIHENINENSLEKSIANTDIVFRIKSQQDLTSNNDNNKNIQIELNAPRIFLTFKSLFVYFLFLFLLEFNL